MGLREEYNRFIQKDFTEKDYKDIGYNLVIQIMNHIGMIRYNDSKIKEFDINTSDIGSLADKSILLIKEERKYRGLNTFIGNIKDIIEIVIDMEGKNTERSVVESLKKQFELELRKWNKDEIDMDGLWEIT